MSFMRTLATLAAGFAAAKGLDKYRQMGGMPGLQKAMKDNPTLAPLEQMVDKFTASMGGASGASGLGGLMAAMGGMAAQGAEQMTGFWDQLTGTKTATAGAEANAKLMIRAMIQAAKADGKIDEAERERLLGQMGDLDDEDRAAIEAALREHAFSDSP